MQRQKPRSPYMVALRKDGTIIVGHVSHTIFAAIPFFAAYSPTTARSLALLILRYSLQLLGPSLSLTLDAFNNSLFTESIVHCDMLLGKELGPVRLKYQIISFVAMWQHLPKKSVKNFGYVANPQKYNCENPVYFLCSENFMPLKFPRIQ